jgi:protein-tyrosine-phosphatase
MELNGRRMRILVLCTHNSVRSPMAEAMLRRVLPDAVVLSAGIEPREIEPFVVSVMAEDGLDLSGHREQAFDSLNARDFDLVLALSKTARDAAQHLCEGSGVAVEYWAVPEPPSPLLGGPREQIVAGYRAIRDEVARHIRARFPAAGGAAYTTSAGTTF